jgi:hypothetical protein
VAVLIAFAALLAMGVSGQAAAAAAMTPSYTAAQAARGVAFYSAATYWGGKTAADVLTYINTMMPPTDPGGVGAQGNADILAYMLKSGGSPAGDKEVPPDPVALGAAAYH